MRRKDFVQSYVIALAPQFYDNNENAIRIAEIAANDLSQNGYSFDDEDFDIRIDDLGLSVRAINILRSVDINTLNELLKAKRKDILSARNCGKLTINEIDSVIKKYGNHAH